MEHTIVHKDELLYSIDSAIRLLEEKRYFVQNSNITIVHFYDGETPTRYAVRQYWKNHTDLKDLVEVRKGGFPFKMFGCWLLRPRKNKKGVTN